MGIIDSLKGALQGLKDLQGGVQAIRRDLEVARREREDVQCALTCRADVKAILARWIDSCHDRYEERLQASLTTMLRKPRHFDDLESQTSRSLLGVLSVQPNAGNLADARSLDVALMALMGSQLKPAVLAMVDSMEWPGPEGLPLAERERKLAELDKRIAKLERDEAELMALAASHRVILD